MSARSIMLTQLLDGYCDTASKGDVSISGINTDASRIQAGDLFIARAGLRYHGLQFLPEAMQRGCAAIVYEPVEDAPVELLEILGSQPVHAVPHLGVVTGEIASRFFHDPSRAMQVIGVTGTNGKSSFVHLLGQALRLSGERVGTMGTIGIGIDGEFEASSHTTADPVEIQRQLARMHASGVQTVAMEVSSHALEQHRVSGVQFDLAAFTNLSRDHLDYHSDMNSYLAAKSRLFSWPSLKAVVLNRDDPVFDSLKTAVSDGVQVISYGLTAGEVQARNVSCHTRGLSFDLIMNDTSLTVNSHLLGDFNAYNLLAVAATLSLEGWSIERIVSSLEQLTGVPGRMNRIDSDNQLSMPVVIVDYAHTPDALEKALTSLRLHQPTSLITVFGCGGDRDRGKRPQMGRIAEDRSDVVILTDDNPRHEDGDSIISDILAGMDKPEKASVVRDRAAAIRTALQIANSDDIVLVAGKGHESYQEVAGERYQFDDSQQVAEIMRALAS